MPASAPRLECSDPAVGGCFVEPKVGIEPTTYALRVGFEPAVWCCTVPSSRAYAVAPSAACWPVVPCIGQFLG